MAERLPESVYRRRRIVVGVVALVVIALVWWLIASIAGGGSGDPQPTSTSTGAASAPATTAASAPPATTEAAPATTEAAPATTEAAPVVAACTDAEVDVVATTDASSYAPDAQPQLSLLLTNASAAPCTIDVGTATQVYTITSGSDTVWVSSHCQQNPTNEVVQLEPGQQLSAPPISWVRERSAPETCDGERPAAVGGGATYNVTASIGGISSGPASFILE